MFLAYATLNLKITLNTRGMLIELLILVQRTSDRWIHIYEHSIAKIKSKYKDQGGCIVIKDGATLWS